METKEFRLETKILKFGLRLISIFPGSWDKEYDWWGEDWDQWEPAQGGQTDGGGVRYKIRWGEKIYFFCINLFFSSVRFKK